MGDRAVITTREKDLGVYLHWHGGRSTVEPMLEYCRVQGYRPPETDNYGWARLCQVAGNCINGTLSLGIDRYERLGNQGDNGIYVIENWKIVAREGLFEGYREERVQDMHEALRFVDNRMPPEARLGGYLDSIEVPTDELQIGDMVWMRDMHERMTAFPVIGIGPADRSWGRAARRPYVKFFDFGTGYRNNPLNYPNGDTVRITPRD